MDERTYLFEKMPIPKAVAKLTVPMVIGSLVVVLYNLADTYFVGMLNDPIQNAAVTLAAPVMLAFNAVNNLFGVGCSSMMSRALGRKDYETAYRSSAFGFYCALFFGLMFSLLSTLFLQPLLVLLGADATTAAATAAYMKWTVCFGAAPSILTVVMSYMVRSEGATLHASIGSISGCILNIILDPIFIMPWGLNMGAAGAGLATFLSNCFSCCYYFVLIFVRRKKTLVCIRPRMFTLQKAIVFGVCAVGVPACIQNLLNVTGMTILNNFTSSYGADAVAAMGIAQKINMIPVQVALGFSQGIMPLISYNYSSGDIRRMKQAYFFTLKSILLFTASVALVYFTCAAGLVDLFIDTEIIVEYGSKFLQGFCLGLPFLCVDFLAVGVFQAVGMGKKALVFAIMRKIVLEIPAIFLLNWLFPLFGLAYSQMTAEVILAAIAVVVIVRLFRDFEKCRKPDPEKTA